MPPAPGYYHRRSIRLKGYDYTRPGAYFVTMRIREGECLFGDVLDGEVALNEYGRIVLDEWRRIAESRPNVVLDEYVVMPNHVHGIIILTAEAKGDSSGRPDDHHEASARSSVTHPAARTRPDGPVPGSIGAIVGQFKSLATKRINRLRGTPGISVWQRDYYEHVIRDDDALDAIRRYIRYNPVLWPGDEDHSSDPSGT